MFFKFLYRYFVKPIRRTFDCWLIRLSNMGAFIETKVISCSNRHDIKVGCGSSIRVGTVLSVASKEKESKIIVGRNTYIGENNNLRAADGIIKIGDNCLISQGVTIVTSNHATHRDVIITRQPWVSKKGLVEIKDGVWIGASAIILPDVTVGEGSVVAAGSVVSKDVPAYSVVAGVPAKVIKNVE